MSPQHDRQPDWWPTVGEEPDPRWTLANERTFLAYERTALGLLVAGLAVSGSQVLADAPLWFAAQGIPLIMLAAAVGVEGRRRFVTTQAAMRTGTPLDPPGVVGFLPWSIAAVAIIGIVAAVAQLAASL